MKDEEERQERSTASNDEVDEASSPDSKNLDALDHHKSSQAIKYHISTQITNEELRENRRYEMNHGKRGIALMFIHGEFDRRSLLPLPGTAKDGSALRTTMGNLGFEVHSHQDKTWPEMREILIQASKLDYAEYDCLFVAIMTHGDQSGKLEAKDFSYNAEEVWDCFKAAKNLAGKPKIFIFQACRGERKEEGIDVLQSGAQKGLIIPSHADYLMVYSCFEGYSSYIDPNHGSWFIQDFCKDLNEYAFTEDMLSILTHTMRRAAYTRCYKVEGHDNKKDVLLQMPAFSSTLTKLLYFYETS